MINVSAHYNLSQNMQKLYKFAMIKSTNDQCVCTLLSITKYAKKMTQIIYDEITKDQCVCTLLSITKNI